MLNRRERRRLRRKERYQDPMTQRKTFHKQLRSYATFHIVIFALFVVFSISFPWFWVSFIWGAILLKRYIQYFRFTDHPTADDEEKHYLPSPRAEDWLSKRPRKSYRKVKEEKQWRDRDLV